MKTQHKQQRPLLCVCVASSVKYQASRSGSGLARAPRRIWCEMGFLEDETDIRKADQQAYQHM